jgi:hypothetical protein
MLQPRAQAAVRLVRFDEDYVGIISSDEVARWFSEVFDAAPD